MSKNTHNWHDIDWQLCHEKVRYLQYKIVVDFQADENIAQAQHNLLGSFSARALAVRTVTSNTGRETSGIDKIVWKSPTEKWNAIMELKDLKDYKAQPVRRVWISKDGKPVSPNKRNGRPLGIPTMFDRSVQTLWNLALSPIAETTGDRHSFGFRLYRSTKDAVAMLFNRFGNRYRPEWVLEADIEGFFNNISHEWMQKNIPVESHILKEWLKAGHLEQGVLEPTESGVPQGGAISPSIANMVLDGLNLHIKKAVAPFTSKTRSTLKRYNTKVSMIRYADDFVVTSARRDLLEEVVKPAVTEFLSTRGLRLSPKKTLITHIEDGFDFLGYNFRVYKDKTRKSGKVLLIRPSRKSILKIQAKIKDMFEKHSKSDAYTLIHQLNPVLRGWANYHRTVVAKKAFNRIGYVLWKTSWRWVTKKHSNKNKAELVSMYFDRIGARNWVFSGKKDDNKLTLYDIANVLIKRHVVALDLNPYLPENYDYFHKRRKIGSSVGIWDTRTEKLVKREGYMCPVCRMPIVFGQEVETHHKRARKLGGGNTHSNLVVLHRECHKQVTYCKSQKLRARFKEDGIIIENVRF